MERTWERCLWLMVNVVIYLHAAFQIATVSHSLFVMGLTPYNALQLVCCSLCVISAVYYENARTHSDGVVACINQLIRLQELNTGRHLGSRNKYPICVIWFGVNLFVELGFCCDVWYCNVFVVLTLNYFAVLGLVASFGIPAICIFYPNNPLFLYYIISEPIKLYRLTFPAVILLEILIWTWTWTILSSAYCWWCGIIFQNLLLLDTFGR